MRNKLFILISLILSGTYIFTYDFIFNKNKKLDDGFGLARADLEKDICPIGKPTLNRRKSKSDLDSYECQKNIYKKIISSNKEKIFFISNSQLGAINQKRKGDLSFVFK